MCFECDDDTESAPGVVWTDSGKSPMHWTDLPIFIFKAVEEVADVTSRLADFAATTFKAHANSIGVRKAIASEMHRDLERITEQ